MDDATPLMVPNATVGDCATDHDMTCAPGRTPRPSRWALPLRALSIPGLLRKLNLGQANSAGVARENSLVGTQNDFGYYCECLLNGVQIPCNIILCPVRFEPGFGMQPVGDSERNLNTDCMRIRACIQDRSPV